MTFEPPIPVWGLTLFWESLPSGGDGLDEFSLVFGKVGRFHETATDFSLTVADHRSGLTLSLQISYEPTPDSPHVALARIWLVLASLSS